MSHNIEYQIVEHIANLSEGGGWKLELNLISWNNAEPKYDIRSWNEDKTKMSKGITLDSSEMKLLKKALKDLKI